MTALPVIGHELREQEPPSELKAALVFGGLYAVVLLAVAFAREYLGPEGRATGSTRPAGGG